MNSHSGDSSGDWESGQRGGGQNKGTRARAYIGVFEEALALEPTVHEEEENRRA